MSFPPGTEMFQFPGFALNPMYSGHNTYYNLRSNRPATDSIRRL